MIDVIEKGTAMKVKKSPLAVSRFSAQWERETASDGFILSEAGRESTAPSHRREREREFALRRLASRFSTSRHRPAPAPRCI
jgi:hypothetical protein